MRDRMEITAPRKRGIKIHIIKPGYQAPYCGAHTTANTKIVTYAELMRMEDRVCAACINAELRSPR